MEKKKEWKKVERRRQTNKHTMKMNKTEFLTLVILNLLAVRGTYIVDIAKEYQRNVFL